MVNNFSILNHRPAKFGMGDDNMYCSVEVLHIIISDNCFWQSLATFLGLGNGITFKIRLKL